jgi:hypothetical protein
MYSISRSAMEHEDGSSMEHEMLTEALGEIS